MMTEGDFLFADSHVHLADDGFREDVDEVITRARNSGARVLVCIGETPERGVMAKAIAARYPGLVWSTVGLHPHEASKWDSSSAEQIREIVGAGVVAIGECGLDYYYDNSPREVQRRAFSEQLSLARELDLPVVVHTREADADTASMLKEAASEGTRGVLHCFTGSRALAETAIECGWMISFSGVVTFKRYSDDEIIRAVPVNQILTESDAPYLAPVPHRGHRNEPAWVSLTVSKLASARDISAARMGEIVLENTREFFRLSNHEKLSDGV